MPPLSPPGEPAPPYPEAYLEALRHHNAGRFFDAHETLEGLWVKLPRDAPAKRFYQAIIIVSTAFHHLTVSRQWNGARKLFARALEKLAGYPERYGGLDVAALRARLAELRDAVDRVERGELDPGAPEVRLPLWPADAGEPLLRTRDAHLGG